MAKNELVKIATEAAKNEPMKVATDAAKNGLMKIATEAAKNELTKVATEARMAGQSWFRAVKTAALEGGFAPSVARAFIREHSAGLSAIAAAAVSAFQSQGCVPEKIRHYKSGGGAISFRPIPKERVPKAGSFCIDQLPPELAAAVRAAIA